MNTKLNRLKDKVQCLKEGDIVGLAKIVQQEHIDNELNDFEDQLISQATNAILWKDNDDSAIGQFATIWEDCDDNLFERDGFEDRPKKRVRRSCKYKRAPGTYPRSKSKRP